MGILFLTVYKTMKTPNLKRQAIRQRSLTRRFLLQMLYQWQICKDTDSPQTVKNNCFTEPHTVQIDEHYYHTAFDTITAQHEEYELQFSPLLNRDPAQLDPIERAILWIAIYEFSERKDIHPTIVINEAIELAKQFGGSDSYKFINGTLDKLNKNNLLSARTKAPEEF